MRQNYTQRWNPKCQSSDWASLSHGRCKPLSLWALKPACVRGAGCGLNYRSDERHATISQRVVCTDCYNDTGVSVVRGPDGLSVPLNQGDDIRPGQAAAAAGPLGPATAHINRPSVVCHSLQPWLRSLDVTGAWINSTITDRPILRYTLDLWLSRLHWQWQLAISLLSCHLHYGSPTDQRSVVWYALSLSDRIVWHISK